MGGGGEDCGQEQRDRPLACNKISALKEAEKKDEMQRNYDPRTVVLTHALLQMVLQRDWPKLPGTRKAASNRLVSGYERSGASR